MRILYSILNSKLEVLIITISLISATLSYLEKNTYALISSVAVAIISSIFIIRKNKKAKIKSEELLVIKMDNLALHTDLAYLSNRVTFMLPAVIPFTRLNIKTFMFSFFFFQYL